MDEYASRFALGTLGGDLIEVPRSSAGILRESRLEYARRDPRGNVAESRILFSSYGLAWEFEFGDDAGGIAVVLDGLCGAGKRSLGSQGAVQRMNAAVSLPDGAEWALSSGILKDVQFIITPKSVVRVTSAWEFGAIEQAAFASDAVAESIRKASAITTSLTLGATAITAFSANFTFTREAKAGGFDLDGRAGWFSGAVSVDMVGKLTVRTDAATVFAGLTGQFTDSLTLVITAGAHVLTVTVPSAVFQIMGRRVVSSQSVDYDLEMLALKGSGSLATFVSSGGRDSA